MAKRSLILFAHGARDPRWAEPFQRLQGILQAQSPDIEVSLAFLELMSPRLPERVDQLVAEGCTEATVVPVFFGQGGHVLRDLPLILDEIRLNHPRLAIKASPAVGESDEVLNAIAGYCLGQVRAG
ncbi:CbiX/SirB N-terminal domain-containing protein [Noviherbaspirillum sp. CPCC 100848]|uniref:CbiX/SirB N-terminal domain-containing protein n=1 Tax=Noviherbaspirillum album TaxID=3080276 RepID=A0ABU6J7U8_9BURK|nr:CbiX/SirB N-terminal domain-containing protein [Noviherbaspirillum sp. CPCC 100848]MEC4719708.1 CbiX/SirB N-terminal domain-containing protein [Noviherbaspirillum sp. CPCC 100848]